MRRLIRAAEGGIFAALLGASPLVSAEPPESGSPPQASVFSAILTDGPDDARAAVIERIAAIGPGALTPASGEALLRFAEAGKGEVHVRRRAVQALSWMPPRRGWNARVRRLASVAEPAAVRATAVSVLGRWAEDTPENARSLLDVMAGDPEREVRRAAIVALARMPRGGAHAASAIPGADDPLLVRLAYVLAVRGDHGDEGLIRRLVGIVNVGGPRRDDALAALAWHAPAEAVRLASLSVGDFEVRILTACGAKAEAHRVLDAYVDRPEDLFEATSEYLRRVDVGAARGRASALFSRWLAHPERGTRAAELLAAMGPAGEAALVRAARGQDAQARLAAIVGLSAVEHDRVVPALVDVVNDPMAADVARSAGIEALRNKTPGVTGAWLGKVVSAGPSPEFRLSAVATLAAHGECAEVAALLSAEDARVRLAASASLPRCNASPEFILRQLVESPLPAADVGRAIAAIQGLPDRFLVSFFGDADPRVRTAVAEAVALRGAPDGLLRECVEDVSWQVRRTCVSGLTHETHDVVGILLEATRDEVSGVQRAALVRLKRLAVPDPRIEARMRELAGSEPTLRLLALDVLGAVGAGEDLLAEALESTDVMERVRAAAWMGQMPLAPRSVEALVAAMEDESELVRAAAAEALEKTGDEAIVRLTLGHVDDGEWESVRPDRALTELEERLAGY